MKDVYKDLERWKEAADAAKHAGELRPDLDVLFVALVGGNDDVRRLQWHVAIDTAPIQGVTARRKESAALLRVAAQALPGKRGDVALLAVDIVAREAGHLRRRKAFAS